MANFSLTTHARKNVLTGHFEPGCGFERKVLKTLLTAHGMHEVYLNSSGLMMVRRHNGRGFGRGYDAADMGHAIELAKSGAIAQADAKTAH